MNVLQNALAYIDDHINPIVIKELRQAVQSRFVTVVLLLYLLAEFITVMLFVLFNQGLATNLSAGPMVFMTLNAVMIVTCLLFIPAYVGIRLAAERADQNTDLVFITTIKPGSIIWGKALTALALTLLVFSACTPFMMMTYLLRGIDIPSITLVLGLDLVVVGCGAVGALFIAALPTRWITKVLLAVPAIGGLLILLYSVIAGGFGLVYSGAGSQLASWSFWIPTLLSLSLVTATAGLLLMLARTSIVPAATNRALPVRIYATVAWLVTGLMSLWVAHHFSAGPAGYVTSEEGQGFLRAWAYWAVILLSFGFILGGSERDEWGLRLRRTIPRNVLLRPVWIFFSSGALGGLVWPSILIALTLITLSQGVPSSAHSYVTGMGVPRQVEGLLSLSCMVLAYVLTVLLLRRYVFGRKLKTVLVGGMAMLLMAAGALIPILSNFFMHPRDWYRNQPVWLFLNPAAALSAMNDSNRHLYMLISIIWCAVMVGLAVPWAIEQLRACQPFRPMAAQVPAPQPEAVATSAKAENKPGEGQSAPLDRTTL